MHGEPDLAIRVVRDVFNEDFKSARRRRAKRPGTTSRSTSAASRPTSPSGVSKHVGNTDLFHDLRVDEQLMKALDRKVWLPSGGSLVIDRTEAMTVIDVNTGKFVGSGGNLEQTVTRNNLEAAEEIVRQLRLRDVGGIVVIDFIDMVLESNRELVLRRLTECLGRDRTKHQVAEVTSLGLVQMTRKRVGEGLLEAFSETCEVCKGRGVIIHTEPVDKGPSSNGSDDDGEAKPAKPRRKRGGRAAEAAEVAEPEVDPAVTLEQRNKALAAMSAIHRAAHANGETTDDQLALELEAVEAVLAGGEVDAQVAAEVSAEVTGSTPEPGADPTAEAVEAVTAVETVASDRPADAEPTEQTLEDLAVERPSVNGAVEPSLAHENAAENGVPAKAARPRRRRAASRPAGPPTSG